MLCWSCCTVGVGEPWPDRRECSAMEGKVPRRSGDGGAGAPPLHRVSAFATTSRLVLGQEAVDTKSNETTAIPPLLERLAAAGPNGSGGLQGALVSIDAITCNATIATAIAAAGADYLLAVKVNQQIGRAHV